MTWDDIFKERKDLRKIKENLIKYCRYYKGEKECPFEHGSTKSFFWSTEEQYIQNEIIATLKNDIWSKGWEAEAQRYIDTHPNETNIYTDKNVSIHTKGIAYYIEAMSAKWIPYGPNRIFKY